MYMYIYMYMFVRVIHIRRRHARSISTGRFLAQIQKFVLNIGVNSDNTLLVSFGTAKYKKLTA